MLRHRQRNYLFANGYKNKKTMTFHNPTPVRIGMKGTFVGIPYRVVGRVVMGMEEEGETYYWQEFNLVNDDGRCATLVCEETEEGCDWKLFTLFEPQNPISVAEARTKRLGQLVNLHGDPLPITLVDESRVHFIEGQAPEGVEVGDVANYFNAERGEWMLVVSWTGEEIEVYRGMTLPDGTVKNAFSLPAEEAQDSSREWITRSTPGTSPQLPSALKPIAILFVVGMIVWAGLSLFRHQSQTRAPKKPRLVASPLQVGSTGKLEDKTYRVNGHVVVEMAQVGKVFDRHEYLLTDQENQTALLIYGIKPKSEDWFLFTPCQSPPPMTPPQAAAVGLGGKVEIDGHPAKVIELFQVMVRQINGEGSGLSKGTRFYGLSAEGSGHLFLGRWNTENITWYRGKKLTKNIVKTAFK